MNSPVCPARTRPHGCRRCGVEPDYASVRTPGGNSYGGTRSIQLPGPAGPSPRRRRVEGAAARMVGAIVRAEMAAATPRGWRPWHVHSPTRDGRAGHAFPRVGHPRRRARSAAVRWPRTALGPPRCPYAWMVLGSGGARAALLADQDSALPTPRAAPRFQAYFGGWPRSSSRRPAGGRVPAVPAALWRRTGGGRSLTGRPSPSGNWLDRPGSQRDGRGGRCSLDFRRSRRSRARTAAGDAVAAVGAGRGLILMAHAGRGRSSPRCTSAGSAASISLVDLKRGGLAAMVLWLAVRARGAIAARATRRPVGRRRRGRHDRACRAPPAWPRPTAARRTCALAPGFASRRRGAPGRCGSRSTS